MIDHKKTLVKLAAYYEKILTPEQIDIYSKQLFEYLTIEELTLACKNYIDNPKNEYFPRPISKLIALVKSPIQGDDFAVEIASRVVEAVSRYGWSDQKSAYTYIGSYGIMAVERFGGWLYICENLGVDLSVNSFQAQAREMIKSNLRINTSNAQLAPLLENKKTNVIDFKIKETPKD